MESELHVEVTRSSVVGGDQPLTLDELPADVGRELSRRGFVAIDVASDDDWLVVLCAAADEKPFALLFLSVAEWRFECELLVNGDVAIGQSLDGERRLHVSWRDWEGQGKWELGVQELLHLPGPGP